jgi:hypothetical protein
MIDAPVIVLEWSRLMPESDYFSESLLDSLWSGNSDDGLWRFKMLFFMARTEPIPDRFSVGFISSAANAKR